jgi:hypothetical protein
VSRTPRQRHRRKLREAAAQEPVIMSDEPYVPSPEFTRSYSRQITLEAAVWDDRGYMRWTLETCTAGSRLAANRNRPNHSTN